MVLREFLIIVNYYYLVSINKLWKFIVRNLFIFSIMYVLMYIIVFIVIYLINGLEYGVYIWTLLCLSLIMSIDKRFSKLGVVLFMICGFMCIHLLFNLDIIPLWVGKGLFWYTGFRYISFIYHVLLLDWLYQISRNKSYYYMNFLVVRLSFCTSLSFLMYVVQYLLWARYPQKDLDETLDYSDNVLNYCYLCYWFILVTILAFFYTFHIDFQHYCYLYINRFRSLSLSSKIVYMSSKFSYHKKQYIFEFLLSVIILIIAIYINYPFIYIYWVVRLIRSIYNFRCFCYNKGGDISKSYSDFRVFNRFNCKNNKFIKLFYHYYVFNSKMYIKYYIEYNFLDLFNYEHKESIECLYFPAMKSFIHIYSRIYSPNFHLDIFIYIHPTASDLYYDTSKRFEFFRFLYYRCPELRVLNTLKHLKEYIEIFGFTVGTIPWIHPVVKDWFYIYPACYRANVDIEYFVKKYYPEFLYSLKLKDLKMYKKLD